ncbi:MAG TPA: bifunctional UDP-3-O-[3-hydroxymyristoyl] N-acetylglucosamine deacetylase/3-hydroxyacyl-ACP dehydratase [Gemmatimonadaceae bacterium]|nr:bifunctional UDP-3-O-[3-hydroxymyristoyl] N-acetylglucosamine deacetylase/3-hydroxyacyl-ACP dehydratase [Gemmatimonadaceae bacterium]
MTRRTIAAPISVTGTGLHLGRPCTLEFRPAKGREGIVFERTDLPGRPRVPAKVEYVTETERRTQLARGEAVFYTVEHVLAALVVAGVDDAVVAMDAPEPPIFDGSAAHFFEAIQTAGVRENGGQPRFLDLTETVRVIDGDSVYEAAPAGELSLDVTVEFPHPLIGRQQGHFQLADGDAGRDLVPARTFGFMREVEMLRERGLIQGATLETSIVLDETGVISPGGLKWPDEFVRHKALDCLGDLALVGARVRARITAVKPSHRGTVTLVREMIKVARQESRVYTIEDIMRTLPHRYPFLLVDRILEIEENKRIVGLKNVTINEPFFQGHFPGHPIMPGVLIIEAMAQVGGMLLMGTVDDPESKVVYFMSLDNVKFRRPVKPGDQIRFELDIIQIRGSVCKMHGVGKVEGEIVAEADMAAIVRDR